MVSLKRLAVEGLFSYAERQGVVFSGRTVIVGPNNAGKSNLFRAISVLADALLRGRNLTASETSESDHDPRIKVEMTLSHEEIRMLVDFFSCSTKHDSSKTDVIPMPDAKKSAGCLGDMTITIKWERVPKGLGVNPRIKVKFPECGFALKGPLKDLSFKAELTGSSPQTERRRKPVPFNTFVKEILESGDPKSSAESFFQSRDTIHHAVSFSIDDMDIKSKLKIKDLMNWLDIERGQIALPRIFGTMLTKHVVHAAENRNLLQEDVEGMFNRLAIDTHDRDGFGYRYNHKLLRVLAHNSLKHTDTLENGGGNIAQLLFNLKNSPKRSDTKRYRTIKKKFRRLFRDQKMDIEPILEYPVVDSRGYGSRQFPRPALVIARKGLPEHLPLEQVGAGVRGVIYLLAAVYGARDSVVMLDEPGINLHPTMIREVMKIKTKKSHSQVITITHSPDLLRHEMARKDAGIVRVGTVDGQSRIYQDADKTGKDAGDPRGIAHIVDPAVFFARLAIVVEGESDRAVLGLADRMAVRKPKYNLPLNNIAVVGVCGKYGFRGCRKLLDKYGIPWIILADEDAKDLFEPKEVSWISKDGVEGDGPVFLLKGDLEEFMEETDSDTFEEFRHKTKVVRALEWAGRTLEENPNGASLPLAEFLDRCLSAASRG